MALCIKVISKAIKKVIDFLNTSQQGVALQTVFKGVVYLAFTPLATMV